MRLFVVAVWSCLLFADVCLMWLVALAVCCCACLSFVVCYVSFVVVMVVVVVCVESLSVV